MRTVTALRGSKKAEPHPLPLTRAWVEDYRLWISKTDASPGDAPVGEEPFAQWLKRNPAPDLQALVERFSKVPVEAWRKFDRAVAAWQARRRMFLPG